MRCGGVVGSAGRGADIDVGLPGREARSEGARTDLPMRRAELVRDAAALIDRRVGRLRHMFAVIIAELDLVCSQREVFYDGADMSTFQSLASTERNTGVQVNVWMEVQRKRLKRLFLSGWIRK